jgi:hypothetical protein
MAVTVTAVAVTDAAMPFFFFPFIYRDGPDGGMDFSMAQSVSLFVASLTGAI